MHRPSGTPRIATVTMPAPDLQPEVLLMRAPGARRGFWAKERRWVAHEGVIADVRVGPPGADDPSASLRSAERFADVARDARALATDPVIAPDATRAPRVRFYGGFSFRERHHPRGVWRAFPQAAFVVPELELEGDDSGDAWLRLRALVDPADAERAVVRMRHRAEAICAELAAAVASRAPAPVRLEARVVAGSREAWDDAVMGALAGIREGRIGKAVLARTLDVTLARQLDPAEVVLELWRQNAGSHVFMFEPEPGSALLGAAPETVATLRDGVFHATAVAGSIRRGDSPREQAELAARLLASDKDRAEQGVTLDDMVARLRTVAHQIRTDPQPHVLTLPRIQHLETEIRASVPAGVGVLDLLRLLHPTPAVCGLPRDAALDLLADEEPFDRGWYAGPVGWFDAEGNGVFAPALRTGVCNGAAWRLFAGAGIVDGSMPASEWDETAIKFDPMLDALRASGVVVGDAPAGARASPAGSSRR